MAEAAAAATPVVVGSPAQEAMAAAPSAPQAPSYSLVRDTRFAEMLAKGAAQVVKGQYFIDQHERKERIHPRQDVPKEYVWDGREAVKRWLRYGPKFLVAVSYAWLDKDHPDPNRFHLQRLSRIVRAHRDLYASKDTPAVPKLDGDIGVLLDYCSFPQKKEVAGTDIRTEAQKEQLKVALEHLHTMFGHEQIMAWRLEEVPKTVERKYADRGWTLFETVVIDAKASSSTCIPNNVAFFGENEWTLTARLGDHARLARLRGPPWTPARFAQELEKRGDRARDKGVLLFTSGKEDMDLVLRKYRDFYASLRQATTLLYPGAVCWGPEDVQALVEALPDFLSLRHITVTHLLPVAGGGLLARRLAELLRSGALPQLREVNLFGDSIGPLSQAALLCAWARWTRLRCFPADLCGCGLCTGPSCLGQGCVCYGCVGEGKLAWLALPCQWAGRLSSQQ